MLRADLVSAKGSPIRAMLAMASEPGMVSLAGGHPDPRLLPLEWTQEAGRAVMASLDHLSLQYGPTEGLPALRESSAALLCARGMRVDAASVLVTTGSQQAISLLADVLIEPGDGVAMAAFNYPAAMQAFRFAGARLWACDDDLSDLTDVVQRAAPARIKAVYVVPNFANPNGHLMPLAARLDLLLVAAKQGICVIEDDPYGELWFDEAPPPTLLALNAKYAIGATVCHAASFSKVLAPALRLGALAAPPELLRALVIVKQFRDVHSGSFEQLVIDRMLRDGQLRGHLDRIRPAYAAKAGVMADSLAAAGDALEFQRPAGGMFFWVQLQGGPDRTSGIDWFAFGRRHRVLVLPDTAFSTDGMGDGRLRLSFANQPAEAITVGVQRLLQGLADHKILRAA